jgi:5-methylcytosine-specific restriction endonuclease McrA
MSALKSLADTRLLNEKKKKLVREYGQCFFCGKRNINLTLLHFIRRSYSRALATDDRNLTLGCLRCHTTYDDGFGKKLEELPNIDKAIAIVREMDEFYANRIEERINRQ